MLKCFFSRLLYNGRNKIQITLLLSFYMTGATSVRSCLRVDNVMFGKQNEGRIHICIILLAYFCIRHVQ
jgi:hypothetical protein